MFLSKRDQENVELEIRQTVNYFRAFTLDSVEREVGSSGSWPYLRSRLLNVFGNKGLEGRIISFLPWNRESLLDKKSQVNEEAI